MYYVQIYEFFVSKIQIEICIHLSEVKMEVYDMWNLSQWII